MLGNECHSNANLVAFFKHKVIYVIKQLFPLPSVILVFIADTVTGKPPQGMEDHKDFLCYPDTLYEYSITLEWHKEIWLAYMHFTRLPNRYRLQHSFLRQAKSRNNNKNFVYLKSILPSGLGSLV